MSGPEGIKPDAAPVRRPGPRPRIADDEDDGAGSPQMKQKTLPAGLSRAIVIAAVLWAGVMLTTGLLSNRYELIPPPGQENTLMYRLDRLTGAVHFCGSQQCVQLPIKPAR